MNCGSITERSIMPEGGIIVIGYSEKNNKLVAVNQNFVDKTYNINKYNYVNDDSYNDCFTVVITDGFLTCIRSDVDSGWGMNLVIRADIMIEYSIYKSIPLFTINDTCNINIIFKQIYNICDVANKGDKLYYINAHIKAINMGCNYYVIADDNIVCINDEDIYAFINNTLTFCPDLVLFDYDHQKEKNTKELYKCTENMYRIYNGIYSGCYLCSREFGITLIKHWLKSQENSINNSWYDLWKANKVFCHKPQLFYTK